MEHTDLATERHGGGPPAGALPSGNASVSIATVLEAAVLCTHDGDGGCLDGVPSIYSSSFSPSCPRLPVLDLPAGGLAAEYSGISVTVHLWAT